MTRATRDFRRYWFGQSLSSLGDAFAMVALPLLVLRATGSIVRMGELTAVEGAAGVVAGLLSGILVDRVDRRRLMIACDLLRAVLWATIPLYWHFVGPSMPLLFVVGALGGLLGNTFQVGCITALPDLVPRDRIIEANGQIQASFSVMFLIGPSLSGILCHRFGPLAAIGINASSFVVSALAIASIELPTRIAPDAPRSLRGVVGDLTTGLRFLLGEPRLRVVTLIFLVSNCFLGARQDLLVYLLKRGMHSGDEAVGFVFAICGAGAALAGLAAAGVRRRVGFAWSFLGAGIVAGIALAGAGGAHGWIALTLWAALGSGAETVRAINSMTVRQEITPPPMLGRVTSTFWSLIGLTAPLGAMGTTALATAVGTRTTLAWIGFGSALVAALGFVTPLRHARESVVAAVAIDTKG